MVKVASEPKNINLLKDIRPMKRALLILTIPCLLYSCGVVRSQNMDGSTVNLSRQGLTDIPEEVFYNENIKVLKLYGNKIEELPERIGELTSLEKLYLGKNNLKSLPESIGKLKNLKLLSVQYNDLEKLPESIGELTNLEQLILNQNNIEYLPESITQLKKLSMLQLKFNELKILPDSIGQCEGLEFIHLNQNLLKELPSSLGDLRKLRELRIFNAGFLLNIPESLCSLRYFELLQIDGTVVVPTCLLVQQTTRLQIIRY